MIGQLMRFLDQGFGSQERKCFLDRLNAKWKNTFTPEELEFVWALHVLRNTLGSHPLDGEFRDVGFEFMVNYQESSFSGFTMSATFQLLLVFILWCNATHCSPEKTF